MTAPPIAPRLEAGISELGGIAGWMHDKHHLRIGLEKRKLKGASAIMPDFETRVFASCWQGRLSEPSGGG